MISPMFVTVSEASGRASDGIILLVCTERPDGQLFLAASSDCSPGCEAGTKGQAGMNSSDHLMS